MEANHCTEYLFGDDCQLAYTPTSPSSLRLSHITFTNLTFPPISMRYKQKRPKFIENARFINVDFGSCIFEHLIFHKCVFDNCNFSNTQIMHLTFQLCIIKNTNLAYENVVIKTINDFDDSPYGL